MPKDLILLFISLQAAAAQTTVMVPMRDGIKLATDLYLPAREGRFPVLLTRTPYNKNFIRNQAEPLAKRGFVVLAQDVRGRFESKGEFYPFINEGLDGYDAIEWAARQPWSNGRVGTFGASYLAWDQYHAAMYKPPHLVAMFAQVGGANFYDEFAYPGGVPNLGWAGWIVFTAANSQEAIKDPSLAESLRAVQKNSIEWFLKPQAERGDLFRKVPVYEKIYRDFFAHPDFDAYWKQRGFWTAGYYNDMKDVPVLFVTGWYDYFAEGVLNNFVALSKRQKTPKKLLVGPWPHFTGGNQCGDVSFGAAAAVDQTKLMGDWFDYCMRARDFEMKTPVRMFRMGGAGASRPGEKLEHGGEWRDAASWPPAGAHMARFYLRDSGSLSTTAPGSETASTYQHDPNNPVPAIGGRYAGCAQNQVCTAKIQACSNTLALNGRLDVLSFVTAPMEDPAEVTGHAVAHLWVSSSAPNADFIVKLIDVYPSGFALILVEGQIRTKAPAGSAHEVTIPIEATSNLFAPGHRIRLDIVSSDFPRDAVNSLKATNTVYHEAKRWSYLDLPMH